MLILFLLIWSNYYIVCIYGDFLYNETNGIFQNENKINFSIFLRDSSGIILYARDSSNNSIIIKLEEKNKHEKEIYLTYNNRYLRENIKQICNCRKCVDEYISFEIITKQMIQHPNRYVLYLTCNKKLTKFHNKHKRDKIEFYPTPKDVNIKKNKTFIWIGNIGPYIGYQNKFYNPIKNQLKGCLDYFYFNNISLIFERKGKEILPNCKSRYEEKIFDISQYDNFENMKVHKRNEIIVNNDCLFWIINETICKKDIPIYNKHNQSYIVNNSSNISIVIKLTWKPFLQKNYCLIEFKLKNGSFLVVYLDQYNDYIYYNHNNQSLKLMKILSGNINNNLLMKLSNNNFTLSINSGNQINTFIGYLLTNVVIINIGLSDENNICTTFEGAMNAKLESENQLELLGLNNNIYSTVIYTSPTNGYKYEMTTMTIPLIGMIILIIIFEIVYGVMKYLIKKCSSTRKSPGHLSNIYETQI